MDLKLEKEKKKDLIIGWIRVGEKKEREDDKGRRRKTGGRKTMTR